MVCQKVQEKLSAYMDQELTDSEAQEVEKHLAQCYLCQREWENLQFTMNLIRQLPEVEAPADFRVKVMEEIKQTARPPFWVRFHKTINWLAASAAVLLIVAVTWGVNPGKPNLPQEKGQQGGTTNMITGQGDTEKTKSDGHPKNTEQFQTFGLAEKQNQLPPVEKKVPEKDKVLLARKELADTEYGKRARPSATAKPKVVDAPRLQPEDNVKEPVKPKVENNIKANDFIPAVQDKTNTESSRGAVIGKLPERLLLKKEKLALQVDNVAEATKQITGFVEGASGYIEDDTTSGAVNQVDGKDQSVQLLVRVPLPDFAEFCANVEKIGQVQAKNISEQDVLPQYHNLVQQVQTLQAQKEQLLQSTQVTGKTPDNNVTNQTYTTDATNSAALTVEAQIGQLQKQIDALNEELEQMESLTGLGTLQVTLTLKTAE